MEETGVAKALETLAVVRWRWKQRECLRGGYIGSGQRKEEVVTAAKKSRAAAEGTGAVDLAAATVAMALADNSGNGVGRQQRQWWGRQQRQKQRQRRGNNNQPKRGSNRGKNSGQKWRLAVLKTEPVVAVEAAKAGAVAVAGGGGGRGWWGEARGERW